MYIYLSKLLPLLVVPIGIVLELSLVSLVLFWRNRRKPATVTLVTAMLVLWVSSMPIVADNLLGRLERQYPAVAMNDIPSGDCIVMLGGAIEPALPPRVDANLLEAADRVYKTASLYAAGKGKRVIVSAGNQPWSPFEQSEASAIKTLLVDWGVPDSSIILDETSRNTRENIVHTWEILYRLRCKTTLLVTSAAHMPRAVASFEIVGVKVFPVTVDFRVVDAETITGFDFFPDTKALKKTTDAVHEWVGQWFYKLRGWN